MTYIIKKATLITYGGREIEIPVSTGMFDKPIRKLKDEILDKFKNDRRDDPFVKCNLSIREV